MMPDSRGEGPPADIGAFAFPAQVIVYQHTFGGVVYVVAARQGDRGWVLVDHRVLTGANATLVINAGLSALSAGRTGKELVVVMGTYVDLGIISVASYTELEIIGKWTCQANLGQSWIVNSDQVGGNTEIEIHGGHVDANKANQNADMSGIYFVLCTSCWIHHVKVAGGNRPLAVARGEGIELDQCSSCYVANCEVYNSNYDNIKLRTSNYCVVIGNICRTDGNGQNQIQLAFGGGNIIAENHCYSSANISTNGILGAAHGGADNNIIIGNVVYANHLWGLRTNGVNGGINSVFFIGNTVYNCTCGIVITGTAGNLTSHPFVVDNYFKANATQIWIDFAEYGWIAYNFLVDGTSTGILVNSANCTSIRFGPHYIYNQAGTLVTDNGTNTQFPSITMQFGLFGSGATSENSGILINAATEYAIAQIFIPYAANGLVKIQISAHANLAEADGMQLEAKVNAGNDNEQFNTHAEDVTKTSTTLNFASGDIIRWSWSDAVITAIKGGDDLTVRVIYAPVAGANINTDAYMRTLTVFYI